MVKKKVFYGEERGFGMRTLVKSFKQVLRQKGLGWAELGGLEFKVGMRG